MAKIHAFDPDWCIAPGGTLRDWIEENKLPLTAAARLCQMDVERLQKLLDGKTKITPQIACALAYATFIPASHWLNLERFYREGLAAGKADVSASSA